ncbi:MAG: M48 family metallopeptidase [Cellvibrionaceae bacterium]|nr:M48 family metallopeptidase [Cellvibrionaceae bacterium]
MFTLPKQTIALLLASFALSVEGSQEYRPTFAPGYQPDSSTDEGGLWYQFDKMEDGLSAAPDVIRDQGLNDYLSNITCKLEPNYCPYIRLYVIDNPHFNASMAPNGMMHIWTGLLLRVENEDELASVIGHELGHFLRTHSTQRWRKIRDGLSTAIFFDLLLTGGFASLLTAANFSGFNQSQETEADLYGIQLSSQAGYSPHASYRLWEHLQDEEELDTSKEKRSLFFATHPKIEKRITALKQHASNTPEDQHLLAESKARLVKTVSPFYFDLMSKHLLLQDFGRTEALLEKHRRMGYPEAQVEFFYAEMLRMRNLDGDKNVAVHHYKKSISAENPPAQAYRELGYILLKTNKVEALKMLKQYLEISPNASDSAMVKFYLGS